MKQELQEQSTKFRGLPALPPPRLYAQFLCGVRYGNGVENAVFEKPADLVQGPVEAHAALQLTFATSSKSSAVAFNQPLGQ